MTILGLNKKIWIQHLKRHFKWNIPLLFDVQMLNLRRNKKGIFHQRKERNQNSLLNNAKDINKSEPTVRLCPASCWTDIVYH